MELEPDLHTGSDQNVPVQTDSDSATLSLTLVFKTKDKPDLLIHAQPVCDPLLDLLQVGLHLDEPQLAPPLDQLVRLHYQQLKEVGILMIFSSFPTTKIHMIQKLPII